MHLAQARNTPHATMSHITYAAMSDALWRHGRLMEALG